MAEFLLRQMPGSYRPRTVHNCKSAKLTIAVAVDYTTAGERLTKTVSGARYYALPFNDANKKSKLDALVSKLLEPTAALFCAQPLTIHFAGNGIYTLSHHDINQKMADRRAYTILSYIHKAIPIHKIFSGGQSGMDEAGIKAALRLGISVEVNMPENNKVRFADGIDVTQTQLECLARFC